MLFRNLGIRLFINLLLLIIQSLGLLPKTAKQEMELPTELGMEAIIGMEVECTEEEECMEVACMEEECMEAVCTEEACMGEACMGIKIPIVNTYSLFAKQPR
jgi:hypothetical protein